MIKIGNLNLPETEVSAYYNRGEYVVTYSRIYQIMYSTAQGQYYGNLIFTKPTYGGFVKRGTYAAMGAAEVNRLVGGDLLNA